MTVTVSAVNDLPVASAIEKTTDEDTALTFAASDFTDAFDDADNHELKSVKLVTLPTAGAGGADGRHIGLRPRIRWFWRPASTRSRSRRRRTDNGPASFTYKATDTTDEESAAAATVTVTVGAVTDAPGGSVTIDGTVSQGEELTANTSAITDADGPGDVLLPVEADRRRDRDGAMRRRRPTPWCRRM